MTRTAANRRLVRLGLGVEVTEAKHFIPGEEA
jgi:hypothetical protein